MYCTLSPAIGDGRTSDAARGAWRRCGNGRLDLVCIIRQSARAHARAVSGAPRHLLVADVCARPQRSDTSRHNHANEATQTQQDHADVPSQAQPHRRSHPSFDGIRHTFKPLRIPIDHHPHENLAHAATGSRGLAAASQNIGLPHQTDHSWTLRHDCENMWKEGWRMAAGGVGAVGAVGGREDEARGVSGQGPLPPLAGAGADGPRSQAPPWPSGVRRDRGGGARKG